jgi:hypothetical protein
LAILNNPLALGARATPVPHTHSTGVARNIIRGFMKNMTTPELETLLVQIRTEIDDILNFLEKGDCP